MHRTPWGRIYLLTREGFFSSLRPLLIFHLIMAVALFGFPFMIYFLTSGFNILDAFSQLASSYNHGGGAAPYLFGTTIFSLVWINKLVHIASPGVYTQLPASAGEKSLSMALLVIGYHLIALVSSLVITLLFSLAVPMDWATLLLWAFVAQGVSYVPTIAFVLITLFALHSFLLAAWCMIHFRKALFGFCWSILIEFVAFFLLVSILSKMDIESLFMMIKDVNQDLLTYVFVGILAAIDAFLCWAIYYRIKTIQLK